MIPNDNPKMSTVDSGVICGLLALAGLLGRSTLKTVHWTVFPRKRGGSHRPVCTQIALT